MFARSGTAAGLAKGGALASEVARLPEHRDDDSDGDD